MKAYVLHGIGDLRYEDCAPPELRPGWALVKVLCTGICSSDIPRIFEKGAYHFPTVPGHEFSGKVESIADAKDSEWVGKRVGVFPLIPCKKCASCQKGQYETCANYDYIGSRRDGGFAEYVAVPVWNLIELPENVSDVQGALLEPAAVALHAVKRAEIPQGASVCVVGTGAIGLLAGEWAKIRGAGRVTIKCRSEAKRQIVQQCGLEYAAAFRAGEEFDCVIEAVGSAQALEESLLRTAPGGRLVLMGNPDGPRTLSQDLYWRILRKQLTLTGTWNSSFGSSNSDWIETVQALADASLQTDAIVSHLLSQKELSKGLQVMRSRSELFCKIMIKFDREVR
ncbi:MAG: galactitol-1-phosphate 5-dehydrogenase [Oscillibacter sp.]|nr:galactitol-1-phosphate 5-dehydrogenase [Oscillibacter sp.]